jgi:endonuclease/exonuclease/phosphatase family metal-dependent hydrolase
MRLRIATFNVWGLPLGLARDLAPRTRAIAAGLAALDVDVLAFQEVWTAETLRALRDAGRGAGLLHAFAGDGRGRRGGLLVLSRLPLREARFTPYRVRGLPERLWHGDFHAGKGFAELRLDSGRGALACFATHLHSQYAADAGDLYRAHRMAQVVQLAAQLRRVRQPVLALGDFNFREDQPHHRGLIGLAGLRDVAAELSRREPTVLSGSPYRRGARAQTARIDYVFVRDGAEQALAPVEVARIFDAPLPLGGRTAAYSDHAGVRAEIELRGAAGSAAPPAPAALAEARELLLAGRAEALGRRRERRLLASGGLLAGGLALLAARRGPLTRRSLLRRLASAGGALGGSAGVGAALLAELASPQELRGFDESLRELDALAAQPAA